MTVSSFLTLFAGLRNRFFEIQKRKSDTFAIIWVILMILMTAASGHKGLLNVLKSI